MIQPILSKRKMPISGANTPVAKDTDGPILSKRKMPISGANTPVAKDTDLTGKDYGTELDKLCNGIDRLSRTLNVLIDTFFTKTDNGIIYKNNL